MNEPDNNIERSREQDAGEEIQRTEEGREEDKNQIPSVASKRNNSTAMTIGFIAVIGLLLLVVFLGEDNQKQSLATQSDQSENFGTGVRPVVVPPKKEKKVDVVQQEKKARFVPIVENAGEKARRDDQARRLAEARRRAPMVIYRKQGNNPKNKRRSVAKINIPGLQKASRQSIDPFAALTRPADERTANERFADRISDQGVTVAHTRPLGDMNKLILQGKMIPAVMETAIQSDLPGMLRAVVSNDVYAEAGRNVLIPQGARLIGQYNSTVQAGQTRLFVIWSRLILPGGVDIALGSPGTDDLGRSGIAGDINTHFWQRFGTSILLSILNAGTSTIGVSSQNRLNAANTYREAIAQAFQRSGQESLNEYGRIQPTIEVPQGTPITVFVAKDLHFAEKPNG